MKLIKFTAIALLLVIVLAAFAGCAFINGIFENGDTEQEEPDNNLPEQEDPDDNKIPEPEGPNESVLLWQAEIYGYANNNVNPEFAENNKIKVAYEYNDPERENAPDSLTFIINDKEAFDEVFATAPFEVDFENETVYAWTFLSTNSRKYLIKEISINDDTVNIDLTIEPLEDEYLDDSCQPYQRWIAVKMKKTDVTKVEFY